MNLSRTISIAAATALCSAAAVPAALAGGEPKNGAPFTRPTAKTPTAHLASARPSALGCASRNAAHATAHVRTVVSRSSRALQTVELGDATGGDRPLR